VIVVSNTSLIISLAAVGQLELLRQLYGKIVIPQAVHREIVIWVTHELYDRVLQAANG
jgi:predicted nucleic acid-binding protein